MHLGDSNPDGVQHLLARADWDPDAVRDELTRYAIENLGHPDGAPAAGQYRPHEQPRQAWGRARIEGRRQAGKPVAR